MNLRGFLLPYLFLAVASAVCAGENTAPVASTNLFVSGQDGYHTYRIPSLLVTPKGTVLAFAEGRKQTSGDAGDIDLLLKRSLDHGQTWEATQTVWNDGPNTCGNPCPVVDRETGTIWLLLTWNRGDDAEHDIIAHKATTPAASSSRARPTTAPPGPHRPISPSRSNPTTGPGTPPARVPASRSNAARTGDDW